MNFLKVALIFISLLSIVILINVLIINIIKQRALKYYIRPYFDSKKAEIKTVKRTGFFNLGDFGKVEFEGRPFSGFGNIVNDAYFFVYTAAGDNVRRYTVRITTVFIFIQRVELKGNGVSVVLIKHIA